MRWEIAGFAQIDRPEVEHHRPADEKAGGIAHPFVQFHQPIGNRRVRSHGKAMNERPRKRNFCWG